MSQFRYINFHWIRRTLNNEANDLSQMASGYKETADGIDVEVQFLEPGDWRADIFNYLKVSARGGTQKDETQSHEVCSDWGGHILQDFGRAAA